MNMLHLTWSIPTSLHALTQREEEEGISLFLWVVVENVRSNTFSGDSIICCSTHELVLLLSCFFPLSIDIVC